ncbi:MAG TPA: sodium:proton antiporter [Cyanothece sp. UBA12306]|nr:sodium:proton antiporter [Cyanothece sp. UBA12306]
MIFTYSDWAILAGFALMYSMIAGGLQRTWISDAMVFVIFGLLFGPFGLGILQINVNSENLKLIVELTLALILFTDAANANLSVVKNSIRLPSRLLLVGLPLTIGLGFGVSRLLFGDLSLVEGAILATMLAPTDAALGKAVVTNPDVPAVIREDLNIESGLNDGICVPILLALLAIATHQNTEDSTIQLLLGLFAEEIGIGLVVGASFGFISPQLGKFCREHNWLSKHWRQVSVVCVAILCFATAQSWGGSGFIASFVGGLFFGNAFKPKSYKEDLLLGSEATCNALTLITWIAFGSAVVSVALPQITWQIVVYAILSLTIVRMVPVFLCLSRTTLNLESKLFVGWFGPRGLASIVFAVIVLDERLPGSNTLTLIVAFTVVLSVLAHGLTANPWARSYGQRMGQNKAD